MRLARCPSKCTAKLRSGECKRVPQNVAVYLAGYYVGCPGCGFPQAVRVEDATIAEEGMDVGEVPRLTVSPVRCSRCEVLYRIDSDEITIVEAGRAR
jgi:hypothetical protein